MIDKLLDELFEKKRLGIQPGLERTIELLDHVGNPHEKYDVVHVAGTNGKGFVCTSLASLLLESGAKVGLYTSPHLLTFNERIRVNGEKISDDNIIKIWKKIKKKAEEIEATFFEITTVMAFVHFANQKIDIAVIETGMGGRFDSTNVVTPLATAITSISYDHMEFLGNTLGKIAFEKAGIIKENIPIVLGDVDMIAEEVISSIAEGQNSELILVNDNLDIFLNLAELIIDKYPWDDKNIIDSQNNLAMNTGYYGRFEKLSLAPEIIIDTAHNPESFKFLVSKLDEKYDFVLTLMQDKNMDEVLQIIKPHCENLTITRTKQDRNADPNIMSSKARKYGFNSIERNDSIGEVFKMQYENNKKTIICGSFFIVAELLEFINQENTPYPELKKLISL